MRFLGFEVVVVGWRSSFMPNRQGQALTGLARWVTQSPPPTPHGC